MSERDARPMTALGKLWTDAVAYVALILGAGVSIAGNVADTFRTRGQATDSLDIFLASFWPGMVVLTVHLFVNGRWIGLAWPMQVLRWVGCLSIGAMAMRVSWVHLNDLMASRGQKADVAIFGPLAIDCLAIMATALILAGRRGQPLGHGVANGQWINPGQVATKLANAKLATGQPWTGPVASKQDVAESEAAFRGQPSGHGLGQALANTEDVATESGQWPLATDFLARPFGQDDGHGHEAADCADAGQADINAMMAKAAEAGQHVGQGLANAYATIDQEASDYLASLANHLELDTTSTPPAPLPQRKRKLARLATHDKARAKAAIDRELIADTDGATIDRVVASEFGVSLRTARRLRAEVAGTPVSGPPDDEGGESVFGLPFTEQ